MLTILLLVAIGAFATNEIVYSPIRPRPPRPLPRLITDGGDFISIKLCAAHTLLGIQPEDVFTIVEGFGLESDLIPLYSRKPYWERNSNYDMIGWEYAQPTDHRWTAKIFGGPKNGVHFVIATAPEGGDKQNRSFLASIASIPFQDSDAKSAEAWVHANIFKTASISIGSVELKLFNDQPGITKLILLGPSMMDGSGARQDSVH